MCASRFLQKRVHVDCYALSQQFFFKYHGGKNLNSFFFAGRPQDHFLHARACYLIKQNSPTCLLCPNESFFGRRHYVSHMIEKHQIPADLMLCIVCGYLTSKYDNFAIHSPKCFPAIKEEFRHQCTHCLAYFYFEQDPYNPFYLSHMNQVHHQIVSTYYFDFKGGEIFNFRS